MITSVTKATDILKLFLKGKTELSLKEISDAFEQHKSSVYRTLSTLVEARFLEKDEVTNKYHLGLIFLDFAGHVLGRFNFRDQAKPFLEKLAEQTREIIHLSILEGSEIVYLDKEGQAQPLTVATKIWGRHPSHCSAMGKVLLSGLSREELIKILGPGPYERMTTNTITDFHVLLKVLECVGKEGYAIDDEEAFPGIRCVAAPIKGNSGKILAAVSATVPIQRMDEARTMEICRMLMDTAGRISEQVSGLSIQ
jgi:IclR family transcriptional regulator, KDG regulon repressor